MKRFLVGLMVAAVAAIGFGGVGAFASPGGTLQTFGTGTVTLTGPDSATIVLATGSQYGGVFVNAKNQGNKPLNAVNFSFVSTGFEAGGAPRFSIPINTSGGGSSVAGYAFIDALGCGGSPGATVTVSTNSLTCGVNFQSVEYTNWATFAADFPSYRIAAGAITFIIADGTAGSYAVSNIDLH
jgi:hypothetical protein